MGEVEQGTPPTPPTKSLTMGKKAEKSSLHLQWKAFSFTTCPLPASPPGRLPLNYVECLCLRPWPGHKVPGWLGPAFAYTFASRPSAEGSVSKKKCLVFKNSDWVLKWESERNILLDLNYLREGRNKVLSCCGLNYWSSVNGIWYSRWNEKTTYDSTMQTFPQESPRTLCLRRKFPIPWKS